MDLSPLIFVALAIAWAVYLVPQALKHHDEVVRSRSVDRFSHTMRVLARREPVGASSSRLVVTPGRVPSAPVVTTKASGAPTPEDLRSPVPAPRPVPVAVRRQAARSAARRRRRVLITLALALAVVVVLAATTTLVAAAVAVPSTLLLGWLIACRLMVKRERAVAPAAPAAVLGEVAAVRADDDTSEVAVVDVSLAESTHIPPPVPAPASAGLWEPLPVTLPTYVSKPAAERRSVRQIDLDATGVWTSGRTDSDAALVREAEQRARVEGAETPGRAVGS